MVHLVKVHQCKQLTHLTSEADAFLAWEAVDDIIQHIQIMLVGDALAQLSLDDIMVEALEEVMYITFQIIAFGSVLPVISANMFLEAVYGVLCSSPLLASTIICYE